MASEALYLKYRPLSPYDVIGQSHIIDILLAQTQLQKFSNAYLLYGPRGTGKTTTARLIAKLVNADPASIGADGNIDLLNDPLAQKIGTGATLDYVEIDAASHTGVDNIREEIINKALYPPTDLRKKVYVIDEVHMLSKGAFNALLKIMEEPGDQLLFVLATTEIDKVPDTIVSRCQVFNFKSISIKAIADRLEFIAKEEGVKFEREALEHIAALSGGALRDAIKYLEQIHVLGDVTGESVTKFLGVASRADIEAFLDGIEQSDFAAIQARIDQFASSGVPFKAVGTDIIRGIDSRFNANPQLWSKISLLMNDLIRSSRRYPQPALLRKAKFFEVIEGGSSTATTQQAPTQSPSIVITPPETQKEIPKETVKETPKENSQPSTTSAALPDKLLIQIAEGVSGMMIKSTLKTQSHVEGLEGGVLKITVINQQFHGMITKPDVVSQIEEQAAIILGVPVKAMFTYMPKEEFMQKQLLG